MTLEGTKEENGEYNDIDDEFNNGCRLCLVRRVVLWEISPDPLGIDILYSTSGSIRIGVLQLPLGALPISRRYKQKHKI